LIFQISELRGILVNRKAKMEAVGVKRDKDVEPMVEERANMAVEVAKKDGQTVKDEAKRKVAEAKKTKLGAKDKAKRILAEAKETELEAKKEAKEIIAKAVKTRLAAKDEAKRILAEAEKAELAAKKEAKRIITESEKAELAARQKAKREAEEIKRAKEIELWAKHRVKPAARGKTQVKESEPTRELKGAGIYEGVVRILVSGVNPHHFKKLEDSLCQIEGLDLLLVGSAVAVGTEFIVSADKPIPLVNILEEMQFVERVTEHGKTIQVTLKAE
jgi:hypothetical protein